MQPSLAYSNSGGSVSLGGGAGGGAGGAPLGLLPPPLLASGPGGSKPQGPQSSFATHHASSGMLHGPGSKGTISHSAASRTTANMGPGGVCMDYIAGRCSRGVACSLSHIIPASMLPGSASAPLPPLPYFQVKASRSRCDIQRVLKHHI